MSLKFTEAEQEAIQHLTASLEASLAATPTDGGIEEITHTAEGETLTRIRVYKENGLILSTITPGIPRQENSKPPWPGYETLPHLEGGAT